MNNYKSYIYHIIILLLTATLITGLIYYKQVINKQTESSYLKEIEQDQSLADCPVYPIEEQEEVTETTETTETTNTVTNTVTNTIEKTKPSTNQSINNADNHKDKLKSKKQTNNKKPNNKQVTTNSTTNSTTKKTTKKAYSYKLWGKTYHVMASSHGYNETGVASWYGPGFHGRKTANGEIYNQNAMTAAHKTLPLNSKVKVTNLQNNKSVVLRVNDRGPYHGPRIIDLSKAAAEYLGVLHKGTAKVRVTAL